MSDQSSFTAEHRSFEWELVLKYEDLSLPASEWNEATLAVVAGWAWLAFVSVAAYRAVPHPLYARR